MKTKKQLEMAPSTEKAIRAALASLVKSTREGKGFAIIITGELSPSGQAIISTASNLSDPQVTEVLFALAHKRRMMQRGGN